MKRLGLKFNEKTVGLIFIVVGLVGLWQGWLGVAEKPQLELTAVQAQSENDQSAGASFVKGKRVACEVLTVYDGDTLGCDLNGDGGIQKPQEQIRLLGIDSPEMRYSRKNPTYGSEHPTDEPFAKEASQWLTQAAQGKMVYLEFDQRRQDKYERTLAYVFAKPDIQQSLNAELLAKGYATLLFLGKNRRYESEFQTVEMQARKAKQGLWAIGF